MHPKGDDNSVLAFISKTGVPLYFDDEGNFRPEGPKSLTNNSAVDTKLQPLYFIVANVHVLKVSNV